MAKLKKLCEPSLQRRLAVSKIALNNFTVVPDTTTSIEVVFQASKINLNSFIAISKTTSSIEAVFQASKINLNSLVTVLCWPVAYVSLKH
jgi:hypothetical protein